MENKNEEVQEDKIVMQIILTKDGQLKVISPVLQDKTACYGLLEQAKDAIREAHSPRIVKPGGILRFARNGRSN